MHDSDPPRFHLTFVWSICLVAAMGGLLFGYDWVVIGGAKPFYEPYFGISDRPFMQGLAMSSALIGCLAGALVAGTLSDRFGRKRLLILAGLLFTISAIGTALSFDFVTFNVFRWIGGAGIGIASSLSPMYIAEVAPAELRGRFVSINQLTIVIGILAAQLVNWQIAQPVPTADHLRELTGSASPAVIPSNQHDAMIGPDSAKTRALVEPEALKEVEEQFPDLKMRSAERAVDESERKREDEHVMDVYLRSTWNGQRGWRWMFGAETFLAAAFFLLMFVVPESPRWLVKFGRDAEAETILARIGGTRYGKAEVADIRRTLADQKTTGLRLSELNEPRLRRIIGLGVFLAVFQQWCGINVIFNYAQEVFEAVGYGVSDIMLNIVITGIVNLVFTFVAIFTVDRFGRRGLMLIGFGGLAVIYAVLGAGFYRHSHGLFMVILVVSAIACYAMSLAPVTWVLISELFPNRVRGAAMSIAVFSLWVACTALTFSFPVLNDAFGAHGTFWLYGLICVIGFGVVLKFLPETKGKSLEQIERELVD